MSDGERDTMKVHFDRGLSLQLQRSGAARATE